MGFLATSDARLQHHIHLLLMERRFAAACDCMTRWILAECRDPKVLARELVCACFLGELRLFHNLLTRAVCTHCHEYDLRIRPVVDATCRFCGRPAVRLVGPISLADVNGISPAELDNGSPDWCSAYPLSGVEDTVRSHLSGAIEAPARDRVGAPRGPPG